MDSELASLHKILKDRTRSKIILLLNEKGNLTYSELMNTLGISSTGTLNYHLKVINDLVMKKEDGQYVLTEKGKLAARLLFEFSDAKSQFQIDTEFPRWYIILGIVSSLVYLGIALTLYVARIMSFSRMILTASIAALVLITFIITDKSRTIRAKWTPKRQMLASEIWIIMFSALISSTVFMVGGSILLFGLENLLRSFEIQFVFPFFWWGIISFTVGPVIGGFIGYLRYKNGKYAQYSYYDPYA
jgi:DNA-binding HxlR family transcriptional regulator